MLDNSLLFFPPHRHEYINLKKLIYVCIFVFFIHMVLQENYTLERKSFKLVNHDRLT